MIEVFLPRLAGEVRRGAQLSLASRRVLPHEVGEARRGPLPSPWLAPEFLPQPLPKGGEQPPPSPNPLKRDGDYPED
jgi:hypothetical protein